MSFRRKARRAVVRALDLIRLIVSRVVLFLFMLAAMISPLPVLPIVLRLLKPPRRNQPAEVLRKKEE